MVADERPKWVVAFVANLMFTTLIESVAQNKGFRVKLIENLDQIASTQNGLEESGISNYLNSQGEALLDLLSAWQPALIIFDLENTGIPWREWVPFIKSSPATRRLPVICFGSNVDVDTMQAAKSRGADAVLARSRFVNDLPEIISQYARLPDFEALDKTCTLPLSQLALKGLELFNSGQYYEAHEVLEEAWNQDKTPGRELYRGILQIGVAYLQIERGNFNGAVKIFLRARQWLDPLPDICRGVDIAKLRRDAAHVYANLKSLGPGRIEEFDRKLFKSIIYQGRT
jgi:predicted metal-dependent hydrolase